eukprot:PLAT3286.26.p1 GENE.PLAT3286.26~~PLAT3286.26.p1  ORF type:complete len:1551 (+),score=830.05 PLAT3286.26:89-4654(+)
MPEESLPAVTISHSGSSGTGRTLARSLGPAAAASPRRLAGGKRKTHSGLLHPDVRGRLHKARISRAMKKAARHSSGGADSGRSPRRPAGRGRGRRAPSLSPSPSGRCFPRAHLWDWTPRFKRSETPEVEFGGDEGSMSVSLPRGSGRKASIQLLAGTPVGQISNVKALLSGKHASVAKAAIESSGRSGMLLDRSKERALRKRARHHTLLAKDSGLDKRWQALRHRTALRRFRAAVIKVISMNRNLKQRFTGRRSIVSRPVMLRKQSTLLTTDDWSRTMADVVFDLLLRKRRGQLASGATSAGGDGSSEGRHSRLTAIEEASRRRSAASAFRRGSDYSDDDGRDSRSSFGSDSDFSDGEDGARAGRPDVSALTRSKLHRQGTREILEVRPDFMLPVRPGGGSTVATRLRQRRYSRRLSAALVPAMLGSDGAAGGAAAEAPGSSGPTMASIFRAHAAGGSSRGAAMLAAASVDSTGAAPGYASDDGTASDGIDAAMSPAGDAAAASAAAASAAASIAAAAAAAAATAATAATATAAAAAAAVGGGDEADVDTGAAAESKLADDARDLTAVGRRHSSLFAAEAVAGSPLADDREKEEDAAAGEEEDKGKLMAKYFGDDARMQFFKMYQKMSESKLKTLDDVMRGQSARGAAAAAAVESVAAAAVAARAAEAEAAADEAAAADGAALRLRSETPPEVKLMKRPISPRRAYLRKCADLGLLPEPLGVVRSHVSSAISLRFYGINDRNALAFSEALKKISGQVVDTLDLTGNRISDAGVEAVADAVLNNDHIQSLNLSHNSFRSGSVATLASLLSSSRRLVDLDLTGNRLRDSAIVKLCGAVADNRVLRELRLDHNRIGIAGAVAIGGMLRRNRALVALSLAWNRIRGSGALAIAESLLYNYTLQRLDLSFNTFGAGTGGRPSSAVAKLRDALGSNRTLVHLDLSYNHMPAAMMRTLCEGAVDSRLMGLHLKGNDPAAGDCFPGVTGKASTRSFTYSRILGQDKQLSNMHQWREESTCWMCGRWGEHTFTYSPGTSGPMSSDVRVSVMFNSFIPNEMTFNEATGEYELTLLVPPGRCFYQFVVDGVGRWAADQPTELTRRSRRGTLLYGARDMPVQHRMNWTMVEPGELAELEAPAPGPERKKSVVKKKAAWSKARSVFRTFKLDSPELLKAAFDADWSHAKIDRVVKREDELEQVRLALFENYALLKDIFKFYAAQEARTEVDAFSIGWNSFTGLMSHCGVVDDRTCAAKDLDMVFWATNVSRDGRRNTRSLSRYRFLEALVRLAERKFVESGQTAHAAEALLMLLELHILPNASHKDCDAFRFHSLYTEGADRVLRRRLPALRTMFLKTYEQYARPSTDPFLKLGDFVSVLEAAKMTHLAAGGELAARLLRQIFVWSKMTAVDEEVGEEHMHMHFVEFLEALGRVAEEHRVAADKPEDFRIVLARVADAILEGNSRRGLPKKKGLKKPPKRRSPVGDATGSSEEVAAAEEEDPRLTFKEVARLMASMHRKTGTALDRPSALSFRL